MPNFTLELILTEVLHKVLTFILKRFLKGWTTKIESCRANNNNDLFPNMIFYLLFFT